MAIQDEGIFLPEQNESCDNPDETKPCCEHGPHHIKPPFHKPNFTIQEQFIETTRRVNETLDRVLRMEKRIFCDMQKFTDTIAADNVAFKDLIVTTYNSFAETVKNEVNSFEAEITNAYDALNEAVKTDIADFEKRYNVFEAEINQKIEDFETSITNSFIDYKRELNTTYDNFRDAIEDRLERHNEACAQSFESFQTSINTQITAIESRMNGKYTDFTQTVNETLVDYENNYQQAVDGQNAVINDSLKYFNENLSANVISTIQTLVEAGELDAALSGAMASSYMRVIDTTVNMLQTDLKVGERVRTLGFYNAYDGGGAVFTIGSETTKFKLANGNGALINRSIYEEVNVKQYGAYGDWQSHKASAEYSTIEELQAVFPYATSLDEEIDTIVIKMLLLYSGGNIYLPKGAYMISSGLEIKHALKIYGDGETLSALNCAYEDKQYNTTPLITITSDNVVVKDLTIHYPDIYTDGVIGAQLAKLNAINADDTTNGLYQNLTIVGFETGLHYGNNSWCNNVENCNIRYCQEAIHGAAEFNNINILNTVITYCTIGLNIRGGRSININGCCVESCDGGIYRIEKGDTNIKNCYFEGNNQYSINLQYGTTAGDIMNIEGCSFYAKTPESFVAVNGDTSTVVRVLGCHFSGKALDSGIASCMSLYSESIRPVIVFENNYVADNIQMGISDKRITGYYENAKRMDYVGTSTAVINNVYQMAYMFNHCESPYTYYYPDYTIQLCEFTSKNMDTQKFYRFAFLRENGDDMTPITFKEKTIEGCIAHVRGITKIYPNKIYAVRQKSTTTNDDGTLTIEFHVMEG